MAGNSLGLQPVGVKQLVSEELEKWKNKLANVMMSVVKPEPIMLLNLPIILSRILSKMLPIILKIPDALSPVTVLIIKILASVYS